MFKAFSLIAILAILAAPLCAQYDFKHLQEIKHSKIKDQQMTGTCWSFSTHSFLESEVMRSKKIDVDLSEMFAVRQNYLDKLKNYSLRQGKAALSDGGLSHDVINCLKRYGLMPESAFVGRAVEDTIHNHQELTDMLKAVAEVVIKMERRSTKWQKVAEAILDIYMGKCPTEFNYEGKKYTARSFADFLGLKAENYINVTSFTHHPFYESFVLEIPDNYANGAYLNVPLADLELIADEALKNGYTISWDGDVSEDGFTQEMGLAVMPVDTKTEDYLFNPSPEIKVSADLRQRLFESTATTDDHLMHIVGIANDSKGNKYYIIKNSWGDSFEQKGYLYMSLAYFQLKTVGITLHKDALPKEVNKKLKN